jgi:hypothetical protein
MLKIDNQYSSNIILNPTTYKPPKLNTLTVCTLFHFGINTNEGAQVGSMSRATFNIHIEYYERAKLL